MPRKVLPTIQVLRLVTVADLIYEKMSMLKFSPIPWHLWLWPLKEIYKEGRPRKISSPTTLVASVVSTVSSGTYTWILRAFTSCLIGFVLSEYFLKGHREVKKARHPLIRGLKNTDLNKCYLNCVSFLGWENSHWWPIWVKVKLSTVICVFAYIRMWDIFFALTDWLLAELWSLFCSGHSLMFLTGSLLTSFRKWIFTPFWKLLLLCASGWSHFLAVCLWLKSFSCFVPCLLLSHSSLLSEVIALLTAFSL